MVVSSSQTLFTGLKQVPLEKCFDKLRHREKWMEMMFSVTFSLLHPVVCSTDRMTSFNTSLVNRRTPRGGDEVWTLYGIFQLGNRLVCSDDASSAPNICQKSCKSEFVYLFVLSLSRCAFVHAGVLNCTLLAVMLLSPKPTTALPLRTRSSLLVSVSEDIYISF